jgi:hypothetical protein
MANGADLGDAVRHLLDRHRSVLRELVVPSPVAVVEDAAPQHTPPVPEDLELGRLGREQQRQNQRRRLRMERYARLQALKQQGWTIGAIAHELGMSRRTVERWNRVGGFPERKPRRRPPNPLAPYADYLVQRWNEGCHTGWHSGARSVLTATEVLRALLAGPLSGTRGASADQGHRPAPGTAIGPSSTQSAAHGRRLAPPRD